MTLRSATLAIPAGQSAEAVLPVVARSAKNGCAEQSFAVAADSIPAGRSALLKYLATRNDFPQGPPAQLATLVLAWKT